jgi:hypothetical protein
MAKFLTTAAITYQVERIILESKKKLVLVSPYIKITKTFLERLRDASERGVIVSVVYGKTELNSAEKKQIDSIPNLKLYFFENLHAKCYFNEREMVITSMNLYEFSERNNREMGIFVTKKLDEEIFNDAVNETHSIIKSATIISNLPELSKESKSIEFTTKSEEGFCIRCKDTIKNNADKPYCKKCYASWEFWNNPKFEEKFCHQCGSSHNATLENPICTTCNSKGINFPLKKEELIVIENLFKKKFQESKINSTNTYVYCEKIVAFGDIMIRDGFEIRFKFNLYSEKAFIEKLKSLRLNDLNYKYETNLTYTNSTPYYLFTPKNADDIATLVADFIALSTMINNSVKSLSIK